MTHERCFKKHDKAEFFPLFIFMEIAEKTNNEKNKFEESENLQISQKKLTFGKCDKMINIGGDREMRNLNIFHLLLIFFV